MSVIDGWLREVHEEKGSDLFVTADAPPCIKVNGKIRAISTEVLLHDEVSEIVKSIMTKKQIREFDETMECQFAIALGDDVRFRVSAFYQQAHIGMVCRRIETTIPTFEGLGLPELLTDLSLAKRGIILFVGATGSGKSTSLAAMVGYRNKRMSGHIISVEDPIEYVHFHGKSLITQREVGIDTDSFEVALRNTLRQAPDVIMIGEVRTRETMEYAMKVCGEKRIVDIIGGFHLLDPPEDQLSETVRYFKKWRPSKVHACHCTDLHSKLALSGVVALKEVGVGLELLYRD